MREVSVHGREPRVLLVFVDGLGLTADRSGNPLVDFPMPALHSLLGGPLTLEQARSSSRHGAVLKPIDANLGVDGLPQSATGQTTLFTGINAAQHMGRHIAAFPGPGLRSLIDSHSLHLRATRAGRSVVFANAFSPLYFEQIAARRRRASVTVLAARSAGLRLGTIDDLRGGRALSWDIERDYLATALGVQLPVISARQAGVDLARLARRHHLTVFETFLPDLCGHGRHGLAAEEVVRRLDGLLEGVRAALPEGVTCVLTSDHGNFEVAEHQRHTRNPVPLLVWGPEADSFCDIDDLCGITPRILRRLANDG